MGILINILLSLGQHCREFATLVWQHRLLALAMVILWIASIDIKPRVLSPHLDPSWAGVLENNARHGSQFGTETVYTYGPLGYLHTSQFSIKFFNRQLGAEFLLKGLATVVFFLLATRLPRFGPWFFVALLFLIPVDHLRLAAMMCPLLVISAERDKQPFLAILFLFLLIPLAMMKFTLTMILAYSVGAVTLHLAISGRWRFAVSWLVVVIVAFLVTWKQIGQSTWNLPAYLINSLSVATGYAASMGREPEPVHSLVGGVAAIALIALIALPLVPLLPKPKSRAFFLTALAISIPAAIGYIVWKHGFTRADLINTSNFFAFIPFLVLACIACFKLSPALDHGRQVLAAIIIACSTIGLSLSQDGFALSLDDSANTLRRNL
jgi:hypothetical protein